MSLNLRAAGLGLHATIEKRSLRAIHRWGTVYLTCLVTSVSALAIQPRPKPRVVLPDESAFQPSAQDGKGTVAVSPTQVPVRRPVTMTLTYTAAPSGIAVGGGVACHVSQFWGWTPPQINSPAQSGYVTVTCSDPDVGLEITCDRASLVVVARVTGQPLRGGQTVTMVYGDTSNGQHPTAAGMSDRYSERDERFFVKVDGDGDGFFVPLDAQAYFRVVADYPTRLFMLGPPRVPVGEKFELTLAALDPGNNLVESFTGPIELAAEGEGLTLPTQVRFTTADRGAIRITAEATETGLVTVTARDPTGRLQPTESNPIICAERRQEQYTLYWGDLQCHSNRSDGSGSPQELYRYARDVARLDVTVLTDHDHWGYRPLDEDPRQWRRLCKLADRLYEPGSFVTFAGYEWTNWTWGHMHVIFENTDEAVIHSWQRPESDDPKKLWSLLGDRSCITIPHHSGGGPVPTSWKFYDPRMVPVMEITSVHGVSERMDHPKVIYSPEESGMAQSALARGYRLGFVGSGDTHDGHPGMRSLTGGTSGLVGIYATSLTRSAILEAIRARRVYATTGSRAVLRFHMGSTPMGGSRTLQSPTEPRTLSLVVFGDAPIAEATLVKNNQNVATRKGTDHFMSLDWTDDSPARTGDYYYVRIAQTDGEWIFSSPIWIDVQ